MARKKIGRILSGGAIVLCVVMFCTLDISGQGYVVEKVTHTISGSAGVSGVTMKGMPGEPVTDENGYYTATVDYGWKGIVTPDKEGYRFSPPSKVYPKVTSDMTNEDYIPTQITFTISGKADMEGVEMNGLPGNPITGSDCTYSVTVEYGWRGTVTPKKEGYEFTPSNRGYPPLKSNQTNQNYTSKPITLLISGSVEVDGVLMDGLPGNPISRTDGIYSVEVDYHWSGTVTPKKEGYVFSPIDRTYTYITETQSSQNYSQTLLTYIISGTAGTAGVEMKGLPGNPITDENGYYTATVDHGFSKTVTPKLDGFRFTPASSTYTNVNSDRTNQNYSPTVITLIISGTTRLAGVEMNGLPGNPITGTDGSYSVTVNYGWNGTVTPRKEGFNFIPDSKPYPSVTNDLTSQNYTPEKVTFIFSGSAGVSGVTMKGLPGKAVVTGPGGIYSTIVEYGWSGTVTPTKDGYEFEPANLPYENVTGPQTNQNYTATLLKRTISGKITSDKGLPVEEAFLLAEPDGGSATTNTNGEYELSVDHGWRGNVTPSRDGYTFRPTYKPYAIVTSDQPNQNFTAVVQMFTISDVLTTPIEGVLITATNEGGTTTTDAKGGFSIKVPYGWSGEIIPTMEGLRFNPPSIPYTNVIQNYKNGVPELPTEVPKPKPPEPKPPKPKIIEPTIPEPKIPEPEPIVPEPNKVTPAPKPEPSEMEKELKRIKELLESITRGKPGAEEITPIPPELLPKPEVPLITNTFVENDLPTEVLPAIAAQAGISIIPEETVVGVVTCDLKEVPLDTALEIVLAGTSYVVKKTPYYYLVCSGALDGPLFEKVSETKRITLNYITATAAVGLLSTAFRNYAQAELGPTAGTDTYTVVVTAPPTLMNRIISDLRQIDRLPSQVLLDARIVVMERGDLLNLGVEWGFPKIQVGTFGSDLKGGGAPEFNFGGKWPWGVQMGYTPDALFTNALELTLNLLAQNGEATILAKPQVFAQDGKQAQIQVMTEEYYMLTAPEIPGFYYTRSELQEIQSGTKLTITPHIGDNNDITLQIAVEVSDSIPRGRGSDLPVVTRRTAENNVTIKDGGTVALAGLTENRTRTDLRRVPGLSKLPLLGPLFKSTSNENSTREIAVFVTARIVPEYQPTVAEPAQPSTIQAPVQPAGEDFRARLRESLLRQVR